MTGRRFQLRAWPKSGRIAVGPFQDWLVEVRRPNGPPVLDAAFQISGGMKAHGHGLPSAPEVRRSLGDGIYLLEGLKFSMAG
ncbi:MAG: auxin-binding protein, partial [Myxococcota bacterium]